VGCHRLDLLFILEWHNNFIAYSWVTHHGYGYGFWRVWVQVWPKIPMGYPCISLVGTQSSSFFPEKVLPTYFSHCKKKRFWMDNTLVVGGK
jgi:hypothetical protein